MNNQNLIANHHATAAKMQNCQPRQPVFCLQSVWETGGTYDSYFHCENDNCISKRVPTFLKVLFPSRFYIFITMNEP